jgi:hypothetical protein
MWNAEKGVFFRADLGLESPSYVFTAPGQVLESDWPADLGLESPSYVCSLLSVRLGPQCCFTAQHAATALPTAAPVR